MKSESVASFDAGLAKRLAEAADSFRDGLYHYFVCKTSFPYDLHYTAGYESASAASDEADTLKQSLSSEYEKFGPYNTDASDEPAIEYDAIHLRFMSNNAELYCETFPNNTDAIILSVSAYDKFFQPYYVRLYGIEAATELRSHAIAALTASTRASVIHKGAYSFTASTGGTFAVAGSYELG